MITLMIGGPLDKTHVDVGQYKTWTVAVRKKLYPSKKHPNLGISHVIEQEHYYFTGVVINDLMLFTHQSLNNKEFDVNIYRSRNNGLV